MPTNYSDSLTTGPSVEPVDVADARRNADLDDTYRDEDIHRWIIEGRKRVEHDARVALINQTRTLELDEFPSNSEIRFDHVSPLSSVTSITYLDTAGDSQTLATSVYKVLTGRRLVTLKKGQSWPTTYDEPGAVTVTYVVGHGAAKEDVPQAAIDAIYAWVRHRLDHPDMLPRGLQDNPYGFADLVHQLGWGSYP